jgi:hypothetical protein
LIEMREEAVSKETVYISYIADDAAVVSRLKGDLAAAGVAVVDRAAVVKPGLRPTQVVENAINQAARFVLCLSSADGASAKYRRDEVAVAIGKLKQLKDDQWLIPVRLTPCELPSDADDSAAIAEREAVDLHDDWTSGIARLIECLPIVPVRAVADRLPSSLDISCKGIMTGDLDLGANDTRLKVQDEIVVDRKTTVQPPK